MQLSPATLKALESLVADAVAAVAAEEGSLLLLDDDAAHLVFIVSCSPAKEKLLGLRLPLRAGISSLAYQLQQPMIVNDAQADPRHWKEADKRAAKQTKSLLVVPISTPEHEFGVLTAINKRDDGGEAGTTGGGFTRFTQADMETYLDASEKLAHRLEEEAAHAV